MGLIDPSRTRLVPCVGALPAAPTIYAKDQTKANKMNAATISQRDGVLVLDATWRVANVTSIKQAIINMANDTMTAVLFHSRDNIEPICFSSWLKLPVGDDEECLHTPKQRVKVPRVVIACNFRHAERVRRTPRIHPREVMQLYGGNCGWTGKHIGRRGTIEHFVPKSRGGKNDWCNVFWASPEINALKRDMTPTEFEKIHGYKRKVDFKQPKERLMVSQVRPRPDRPEWDIFLCR